MIRLNLLPWREQRRRERKQQFQRQLGLVAVLALSVVLVVFLANAGQIAIQWERNQLLTKENAQLDASIREIKELEQRIASLNARRLAIEQLQYGRAYPVRLLDELAHRVPQGVVLRSLKQSDGLLLNGVAQSNARVNPMRGSLSSCMYWMTVQAGLDSRS